MEQYIWYIVLKSYVYNAQLCEGFFLNGVAIYPQANWCLIFMSDIDYWADSKPIMPRG